MEGTNPAGNTAHGADDRWHTLLNDGELLKLYFKTLYLRFRLFVKDMKSNEVEPTHRHLCFCVGIISVYFCLKFHLFCLKEIKFYLNLILKSVM